MKFLFLYAPLLYLPALYAMPDDISPASPIEARKGENTGRLCDFSDGYYVPWTSCSDAIVKWCRNHAGQSVPKGAWISDGPINGGYKSGKWNVELFVKYQNDHIPNWQIDEEACIWYLSYIAQGCTKGGNKPSGVSDQASDGGTFYEPLMGSIDFKWQYKS